ncbi:hypothetical protein COV20_00845 [Candidatus Woesearchaeota archaeon CG10_big_fil_rev_8_21_14_0_10_45_16]|nr:MAG: hypothetical protein COV20_00845 [Candidatus Woesearchaeota archaeon CG10_big_fil_rev_8_21_14_0_10_45_16]
MLEEIVWKEDRFVKVSNDQEVNPSPRGPFNVSFHPETLDYVSADFLQRTAEYHNKEFETQHPNSDSANAFYVKTITGDGGGEFVVVQLYRI